MNKGKTWKIKCRDGRELHVLETKNTRLYVVGNNIEIRKAGTGGSRGSVAKIILDAAKITNKEAMKQLTVSETQHSLNAVTYQQLMQMLTGFFEANPAAAEVVKLNEPMMKEMIEAEQAMVREMVSQPLTEDDDQWADVVDVPTPTAAENEFTIADVTDRAQADDTIEAPVDHPNFAAEPASMTEAEVVAMKDNALAALHQARTSSGGPSQTVDGHPIGHVVSGKV